MIKTIKYIKASILFILLSTNMHAQTLSDALQYSFYDYVGTARTAGVGGAFGALGGDQGAININPASLGTYQKGEFVISPTYFTSQTNSSFQGNSRGNNSTVDIKAINMGFVFSSTPSGRSRWKTSNISINYNKITDFERNVAFKGSSSGSIMERFAERANGKALDQLDNFEAGVAYDANALIGPDENLIYGIDPIEQQIISKEQTIRSKGGMSEFSIAWGGNYDDKLQIGFALGIPFTRFEQTKSYSENAIDDKSPFKNLTYNEYLKTTGSGLNLKLGVIATPVKSIRIGASIASPTNLSLSDEYNTSMSYSYINFDGTIGNGSSESPDGSFDYEYNTPWKTTGSFAYLMNTDNVKGFISAEVDYLAYTSGRFNLTSDSDNPSDFQLQEDLNNQINVQLKNAVNFRVGGELAFDIYRLRAGYQLNGSPYFKDDGKFFTGISLGGGFRFDKFFIDLAFKTNSVQQGYIPYLTTNIDKLQLVQLETTNSYFVSTFGFKF